jgi:hypothetical protein
LAGLLRLLRLSFVTIQIESCGPSLFRERRPIIERVPAMVSLETSRNMW